MSYVAIGLAVAGTVTAGVGAYQANKSAKAQAQGAVDTEARRAAMMQQLFADRNPGAATMEGLEAFANWQLDVDPLDYQKEGFQLTEDAQSYLFEQADKSFNRVMGSNRPLFETFLTDNLERANYDFSSLPPEIMRRVEGSALSRSLGGPAGLAENLSVENKIRLQQQGESSAFRALGFRAGFEPDILNPIPNVFALADFERTNQIQEANVQMGALGALGNLEMQRFGLEAGFQAQPINTAGISQAANANMWNAASQGLSTLGSAYGAYSSRTAQQPTIAASNYPAQQYSATPDWRTNATSIYNPSTSVYYRG